MSYRFATSQTLLLLKRMLSLLGLEVEKMSAHNKEEKAGKA